MENQKTNIGIGENCVSIYIDEDSTDKWSRGLEFGSSVWPCSTLAGSTIEAFFNDKGMLDLSINGNQCWGEKKDWVDGNEFNAIVADMLKDLDKNHPCYFVLVGQFI